MKIVYKTSLEVAVNLFLQYHPVNIGRDHKQEFQDLLTRTDATKWTIYPYKKFYKFLRR